MEHSWTNLGRLSGAHLPSVEWTWRSEARPLGVGMLHSPRTGTNSKKTLISGFDEFGVGWLEGMKLRNSFRGGVS